MNLEKKSLVKVVHFFRYSSEKINFEMLYRHMWKMQIFKLNFWSKFQRKKTRQIAEPFSRTLSYLFCTVLSKFALVQTIADFIFEILSFQFSLVDLSEIKISQSYPI